MFRRRSVVSVGDRSAVSAAAQSSSSKSISRIYGPREFKDEFVLGDLKKESRPILSKIARCYSQLKDQKLGYAGFCFGLLDPASNIYVNYFLSPDATAWDEEDGDQAAAGVVQRSFNGLHAFLTCLFLYLPNVEAARYLDAADADPLVAALLIINRRGTEQSFRLDSDTTAAAVEVALRCAAVAARHPDPQKLVQAWKLVSPDRKKLLPIFQPSSNRDVLLIPKANMEQEDPATLDQVLQLELEQAWELAKSRHHRQARPRALPLARAARKRVLIGMIRRFYLMALAKFPKDELCSRYHHSLIKAGHCYGPLDPVSNIIINTVWYGRAFPPSKQVTIHMISTRCLMRIVARLFYGLVSFMCTRYPDRTADQVLERLLVANADLPVADPTLGDMAVVAGPRRRDSMSSSGNLLHVASFRAMVCKVTKRCFGGSTTLPSSLQSAYTAAATAACHPAPHEQQVLLGSPDSLLKLQVAHMQVLHKDDLLSSNNVEFLGSLLMSPNADECCQQQQPEPRKVDKYAYMEFSYGCLKFWNQHNLVQKMVGVALAKFNRNKVHKYRLHFICGVNELVSGPEYNRGILPSIYHHTHVNFLVTCEDPQFAHEPAMLFFAECGNYNTKESWCFPVNPQDQDTKHVRCIYYEKQGITIVHPAVRTFHGRDREFDKVLRGERLFTGSDIRNFTNHALFAGNAPDRLDGILADDFIYCDYVPDPNAREIEFPFMFFPK